MNKPWYLSRMVWVNSLTLLAGMIGYMAGHELIADNASLIALLIATQGAVNVVLRFVTWESIS